MQGITQHHPFPLIFMKLMITRLHLRLEYWNSNEENMTERAIYSEAVSLCFYGNAPPIVTGLMAFKALPVDIKAVALLNYLP